eukprot:RCo043745
MFPLEMFACRPGSEVHMRSNGAVAGMAGPAVASPKDAQIQHQGFGKESSPLSTLGQSSTAKHFFQSRPAEFPARFTRHHFPSLNGCDASNGHQRAVSGNSGARVSSLGVSGLLSEKTQHVLRELDRLMELRRSVELKRLRCYRSGVDFQDFGAGESTPGRENRVLPLRTCRSAPARSSREGYKSWVQCLVDNKGKSCCSA